MFKKITLEMSLKPFKQTDETYVRNVIREVFLSWRPLLKNRPEISVMLWVGDGSEILDYTGNMDAAFEWAYYIGTANRPEFNPDVDIKAESLHSKKRKYIANPPEVSYRTLQSVISIIKDEGKKLYPGSVITVGETMDIGPEFAVSDFKYSRHREIINFGSGVDSLGFIDASSKLHGDSYHYAAFPDGIDEGTDFGYFFGLQANRFLKDMGFDYIWLSNGLGFSADPWKLTGKIFDGEKFHPERLKSVREKVFGFWDTFRKCNPDIAIETRGTNNTVGIDYAADGVPLYEIYKADFGITPPPNSPWAALNNNYGLELAGHMSRNAELPGNEFMFRYYIHDPWWMNSPWYDRYEGYAGDIYLPMAVSRIDKYGKVQTADLFNILSIDNSHGDMPEQCINEPVPHILKAEKDAPDEPSPLVWVYPVREYTTAYDELSLKEMYFGDKYIVEEINKGLPLCCVTSTDSLILQDLAIYRKSVLISPVPADDTVRNKLKQFVSEGGKVIFYVFRVEKFITDLAAEYPDNTAVVDADVKTSESGILAALSEWGLSLTYRMRPDSPKPPTTAVYYCDHALFLSLYNADTTSETCISTPLGAPVPLGMDTVISDDASVFHFGRCEHKEIRVFVKQKDGVVTAQEAPPVSAVYRRRIAIKGLKDATVYFFPEDYCESCCDVQKGLNQDAAPAYTDDFKPCCHEIFGECYKAEHVSGSYTMLMPDRSSD